MLKITKIGIFLVALIASVYTAVPARQAPALRSADQNLMQFMLRSSALSQGNPTRSVSCFDYYIPVLNGITAEYERAYAACLTAADDRRVKIDDQTADQRAEIEASAQSACDVLQSCSAQKSSIPYFECYVNAGSENTKVMYGIQQNSSTVLDVVREEYRLIENDQNRCTNSSERAYVENTANTYQELQSCLQGKSPVPSTTTASTTTASTTLTTATNNN